MYELRTSLVIRLLNKTVPRHTYMYTPIRSQCLTSILLDNELQNIHLTIELSKSFKSHTNQIINP